LEYVKRAYGVGIFFYLIGYITIPIPHAQGLSAAAGGIGTTLLVGASVAWLVIRIRTRNLPSRINVMRMVAFMMLSLFFPVVVAALASSGQTADGYFGGNGYNWQHWTAHIFFSAMIWMLYLSSIELPLYLHKYIPRSDVTEQTLNLIPSWGSGAAAILTGFMILDLHFASGPLAHTPIMPVLISAVAVATLLLPFYRWAITRIWISGIIDLFSFPRWRSTISAVIADIDSITDRHWWGSFELGQFMEHLKKCEECRKHFESCSVCRQASGIETAVHGDLPGEA
jgi:hypothetical protein